MSIPAIRAALEARLATLGWANQTEWPNVDFTPTQGTPYQIVSHLGADTGNPTLSGSEMEQGILQVRLMYPLGVGQGDVQDRAEVIRTGFAKNLKLTAGSGYVMVKRTPTIASGYRDGDRWSVPVSIRWANW